MPIGQLSGPSLQTSTSINQSMLVPILSRFVRKFYVCEGAHKIYSNQEGMVLKPSMQVSTEDLDLDLFFLPMESQNRSLQFLVSKIIA